MTIICVTNEPHHGRVFVLTGLIAVWGQLDRESTDHYLLTIQARDVQTEGVSYSDMHLTIIIEVCHLRSFAILF